MKLPPSLSLPLDPNQIMRLDYRYPVVLDTKPMELAGPQRRQPEEVEHSDIEAWAWATDETMCRKRVTQTADQLQCHFTWEELRAEKITWSRIICHFAWLRQRRGCRVLSSYHCYLVVRNVIDLNRFISSWLRVSWPLMTAEASQYLLQQSETPFNKCYWSGKSTRKTYLC